MPFKIYDINNNGFTIEVTDDNVLLYRFSLTLNGNSYNSDSIDLPISIIDYLFSDTEYTIDIDFRYSDEVVNYTQTIKTLPSKSLSDFCSNGTNLATCIINNYNELDKVYYHDNNLVNGAEDYSYRYSGDNPNNYVCFGSNEEQCPYDNLYRIIGVFDDDKDGIYQTKLIKADYATYEMLGTDGAYTQSETTYDETQSRSKISSEILNKSGYYYHVTTDVHKPLGYYWNNSELNLINLNHNYLNSLSEEWQNKIAISNWYGANAITHTITPKEMYILERTEEIQDTKKIGLMYASDFGYAAGINCWSSTIEFIVDFLYYFLDDEYNVRENPLGSWLFISPGEGFINNSHLTYLMVGLDGTVNQKVRTAGLVRPCFYLTSDVAFQSGDGTEQSPYRIN